MTVVHIDEYAPRGSELRKTLVDLQTVTTRCAFCDWTQSGTVAETRAAFAAHRTSAHPTVTPSFWLQKAGGK